jgi:nitrogen fixation protein FixH
LSAQLRATGGWQSPLFFNKTHLEMRLVDRAGAAVSVEAITRDAKTPARSSATPEVKDNE